MKIRIAIPCVLLFILLAACHASTPEPVYAIVNTTFTLSPGQMVTLRDANLSITFLAVSGDERCPSEIECAASGPVTIQLSILDQNGTVSEEVLQTFTDSSGLAPSMEFEGIKSSLTVGDYQVRVTSVLPYPKNRSSSIKSSDYLLGLKVTRN